MRTFVPRICETCGKAFETFIGYVNRGKGRFCSRSCAAKLPKKTAEQSFWEKIEKVEDNCWKWTGAKTVGRWGGYGHFEVRGVYYYAHRFSYELHHGPLPTGMFVCHRCDNPECANPEHLFAGTPRDNFDDMRAKGRHVPPPGRWGTCS